MCLAGFYIHVTCVNSARHICNVPSGLSFAVVSGTKEACLVRSAIVAGLMVLGLMTSATAFAQITPAAGFTPPDDTPSIKVGMTLYPAFTYQANPTVTDGDGNAVNRNAFDVLRAYINLTGN